MDYCKSDEKSDEKSSKSLKSIMIDIDDKNSIDEESFERNIEAFEKKCYTI